jgi:hypothetical protein
VAEERLEEAAEHAAAEGREFLPGFARPVYVLAWPPYSAEARDPGEQARRLKQARQAARYLAHCLLPLPRRATGRGTRARRRRDRVEQILVRQKPGRGNDEATRIRATVAFELAAIYGYRRRELAAVFNVSKPRVTRLVAEGRELMRGVPAAELAPCDQARVDHALRAWLEVGELRSRRAVEGDEPD